MNKQSLSYLKVGATSVVVVALLLLFGTYISGKFNRDRHINILYADAKGIQKGEIIQMAGVNIGQVDEVGLTPDNKRAMVRIGIHQGNNIPQGSRFVIRSGVLGNTHTLTVEPNYRATKEIPNDATVEGEAASGLDTALADSQKLIAQSQKLIGQSQDLVASFQRSAGAFEKLATDPTTQKSLKNTLRNLDETTAGLPVLQRQVQSELSTLSLQANQLLAGLQTTKRSADKIAANTEGLTGDLRDTLKENRSNLKALIRDADEAASAFAGIAEQAKTTLGDKRIQNNLTTASDNLASITARLDATTADLQRLSSDPRLSSDIRETVGNLKDASASAKNLAARVETIRIPGERRRPQPGETPAPPTPVLPFSYQSLMEPGLVFDGAYDTKGERFRADAHYTLLAPKSNTLYRLGIRDITEGNRLDAQIGSYSGSPARFDYRYGIVAGKLGGGVDFRTGPVDFRFDLYDPNRFTVNARAKTYLNRNTAITAGVDSVGKDNRAVIGVQILK